MSVLHLWAERWAEPALLVTWLLALFAVLAVLCERLLHLRSARVRHALWWFVLLAPLVIAPVRLGLSQMKAMVPVPIPLPRPAAVVQAVPATSPAAMPTAEAAPALPMISFPPWWQAFRATDMLALLWAFGLTLLALRLLISHRRASRLLQESVPIADVELCTDFAALCAEGGLKRAVALHHSDAVGAPALYGWRCPVVLLPAGLLAALNGEQVRALLAHEVAHLRRRDFAANLLQRLLEAALFFHPAVWLASRRLTLAREELCDAWALGRGVSVATYARSLAEAVAHARLRRALALVSLAEEKSSLRRRVEAIMGGDEGRRLTRRMGITLVAAALCAAVGFAVVQVGATPGASTTAPAYSADLDSQLAQMGDLVRDQLVTRQRATTESATAAGEGFVASLRGVVKAPLTPEQFAAITNSLNNRHFAFPNPDITDLETQFNTLRWTDYVKLYLSRPALTSEQSAQLARQMDELVAAVRQAMVTGFGGDMSPGEIDDMTNYFNRLLTIDRNDPLAPALKRPFTDDEMAVLRDRAEAWIAKGIADWRARRKRVPRAASGTCSAINSLYGKVWELQYTTPTLGPELMQKMQEERDALITKRAEEFDRLPPLEKQKAWEQMLQERGQPQ